MAFLSFAQQVITKDGGAQQRLLCRLLPVAAPCMPDAFACQVS